MAVVKTIKGIIRQLNTGNLIFAVIPALGVVVNYGIKKIVEHEMQKTSTGEKYCYSSSEQDADNQSVNFTFGTGYSKSTDDQNVNFTFGGNDSSKIKNEDRKNCWWMDEIINPQKKVWEPESYEIGYGVDENMYKRQEEKRVADL